MNCEELLAISTIAISIARKKVEPLRFARKVKRLFSNFFKFGLIYSSNVPGVFLVKAGPDRVSKSDFEQISEAVMDTLTLKLTNSRKCPVQERNLILTWGNKKWLNVGGLNAFSDLDANANKIKNQRFQHQ